MKKMLLAVFSIGLAAMLSACGDDDSSSGGSGNLISCDMTMSMSFAGVTQTSRWCGEGPNSSENASELKKECVSMEDEGFSVKAEIGSGCPSGAKKICDDEDGRLYYYDDGADLLSCDELAEE